MVVCYGSDEHNEIPDRQICLGGCFCVLVEFADEEEWA